MLAETSVASTRPLEPTRRAATNVESPALAPTSSTRLPAATLTRSSIISVAGPNAWTRAAAPRRHSAAASRGPHVPPPCASRACSVIVFTPTENSANLYGAPVFHTARLLPNQCCIGHCALISSSWQGFEGVLLHVHDQRSQGTMMTKALYPYVQTNGVSF